MTRRRYLTPKRKAALWHDQDERCAECGEPTLLSNMRWDHILPLWAGGDNRFANWQGLCERCDARKTKREAGMRAKADRQRKYHEGTKKRRGRPMPSRPFDLGRGFDPRLRKRISGRVEVRT